MIAFYGVKNRPPMHQFGLNVLRLRDLKRDQGVEPLHQLTPGFYALAFRRAHDGESLFGGDTNQSRLQRGRKLLQGRCKARVFDPVFRLFLGDQGLGKSRVAFTDRS